MIGSADYQRQLAQEAERWGMEARQQAAQMPPDWRFHRRLRHNRLMHTAEIDRLLNRVQPGMRALELGCASGWLTLALAQRGAHALGLDIAEEALAIARDYYERIRDQVSGTAEYCRVDLNALDLPAETYDLVVVKGTLHHLIALEAVIAAVHAALKPGGLLWVSDSDGEEAALTALIAGALTFILPTQVSYREKVRGLLRFGLKSAARVRASMQAEGLSPFEGAGRGVDWLKLIEQQFMIESMRRSPAFTGYLAHQVRLPEALALPLLYGIRAVDAALVRLGALRSTGVVVTAMKR
jgi:2-polyprenyl-3-methyl-5-hydroxy-6-metoxy-1,4-benzoquinol methylase